MRESNLKQKKGSVTALQSNANEPTLSKTRDSANVSSAPRTLASAGQASYEPQTNTTAINFYQDALLVSSAQKIENNYYPKHKRRG